MAEKLLEAIAKGSYRAAADPVKQATKAAVDPNIMATIYKTGIIGPLIRNVISEYRKGEKDSPNKIETAVISDISKNLNSLSNQLSSIADIMEEIRILNLQQLNVDKDKFVRERKEIKKGEVRGIEEKLEARKPSITSLTGKGGDKTRSFIGEIGGFIKNNPVLSALVLGTLTAFSDELQQFFKGVLEGSKFDEVATSGAVKLRDTIGIGIDKIFENVGISIDGSLNKVLSSGVIGALIGRIIGLRLRTGFLAGAGAQLGSQNANGESSFEDSLTGAITAVVGGLVALELGKYGLKKGGEAILNRMKRPKIEPQTKPSTSSIPTTPEPSKTTSGVDQQGRAKVSPLNRTQDVANKKPEVSRGTLSDLVKRLKRVSERKGKRWVAKFIMMRLGSSGALMALGGATSWTGVGLILFLLGVGFSAYQLYDIISEMEEADNLDTFDTETGNFLAEQESIRTAPSAEEKFRSTNINPTFKPSISSFGMDDYEKSVIAAESGGQNIRTTIDPTGRATAFGYYQITKPTFEGLRKNYSDLKDYTYEQFQNSKEIQQKFFQALTKENSEALQRAGMEVDKKNLYVMHRFGQDEGLKILRAFKEDPNKPLKDIVRRSVIDQNVDLTDATTVAGAVLGSFAKMDKNIQVQDRSSMRDSMSPVTNPLYELSLIKELQALETQLTGKPSTIVIDNSQNISGGGSSTNENRRGNAPVSMPYVREHDRIFPQYAPYGPMVGPY